MISLKKLCLNQISEEFEKFHLAFTVSNDETVKRHFHFLFRKYSFEILSELSSKRKLKGEYLDCLINEHLKCLNCDWFIDTCYENAMGDILCRVPNLTKLHSLEYKCCDEIVEHISKFCPKIVEFHAGRSAITDDGIKYLCKNESGKVPCPALKCLDCNLSDVTDEGLKRIIQDLPSLETIHHRKMPRILYSIHKEELPDLENVHFYNLVELVLYDFDKFGFSKQSYDSDILKICLTVCPRLKNLYCYISDKEQLTFFENIMLEKLFIEFLRKGPKINVNTFLKNYGCNLTTLQINNCMLSTSLLATSCPKLEFLNLTNVIFLEDDSEPVFRSLMNCMFRDIKNDSSSHKAVRSLLFSPKLQEITFSFCCLSPDIKSSILSCCENYHLKNIYFLYTQVEMNFVKDILLCCSSLTNLELYECYLGKAKIKELEEFAATRPNKPCIKIFT